MIDNTFIKKILAVIRFLIYISFFDLSLSRHLHCSKGATNALAADAPERATAGTPIP